MSNMAYCRFQNTLQDLGDCEDHIDETEDLSEEEAEARLTLIETCKRIAKQFEE